MKRAAYRLWSDFLHRRISPPARSGRSRMLRVEPLEMRAMLTTFFVDADLGDDANPGSAGQPFATIQRAIDEADDAVTAGADRVVIRPGTYVENLTIDDADPLILRGTGASQVVAADDSENVIDILAGDVTIRNLRVTGGDNGIEATGDSLTLVDVDATGNERHGLSAEEIGNVTILRGNYSDNGRDGINVDEVEQFSAHNARVVGNDDDGLQVEDADSVNVFGGRFSHNGDDGLKFEDIDEIHLQRVTVRGNESDGLDVEDSGTVDMVGGVYSGNGDEGAEFDDIESVTILGGTFMNNADEGIDIDSTESASLEHVVAMFNGGSGLQMDGEDSATEVSIVRSIFSHNGEDGLNITNAGDINLLLVTGVRNDDDGLQITDSAAVVLDKTHFKRNGDEDMVIS